MLTKMAPYGEYGPEICFRDEDTDDLLWRASMPHVPQPDSRVGHLRGTGEVATWYKVESVLYEFEHDYTGSLDASGNPVPYDADSEYFGVCVYVSEV